MEKQADSVNNLKEHISLREKLCVATGNFGMSMVWYLTLGLATFYYTDVVGMAPALVGTILIASRLFDGISDFTIGYLVDKTDTRWGKVRPWILFSAFPYVLSMVLMYAVPESFTGIHQTIYVFLTYNFAVTIGFTAANIPYHVLPSLITRDQKQRSIMYVFNMVASPLGGAAVTAIALPFIEYLGGGHRGWTIAMTVFAVFAFLCQFITFAGSKERIKVEQPQKEEKGMGMKRIKSILSNKYWWIFLGCTILYATYNNASGSIGAYYCKYILGNELLFSGISLAERIPNAIAAIVMGFMVYKFTKRHLVMSGFVIVIVGQILTAIAPTSYALVLIGSLLRGTGWGCFNALLYSIMADLVEYGYWRTGVRAEGTTFTGAGIGNKLGSALGAGGVAIALQWAGYNGMAATQIASANSTISFVFIYLPILIAVVMFILMAVYKVDKIYDQVMDDLLHGKFSPLAKF